METTHTSTDTNHASAVHQRVHLTTDEPIAAATTNVITDGMSKVSLKVNSQMHMIRRRWKKLDPDAQKALMAAGALGIALGASLISRPRRRASLYEQMVSKSARKQLAKYSDMAAEGYKASRPLGREYMTRARDLQPQANKLRHDLLEMITGALATLAVSHLTKRFKKRLP